MLHKEFIIKRPMDFFILVALIIILFLDVRFFVFNRKRKEIICLMSSLFTLILMYLKRIIENIYNLRILFSPEKILLLSGLLIFVYIFIEKNFYFVEYGKHRLSSIQIFCPIIAVTMILLRRNDVFLPYDFIYTVFVFLIQVISMNRYNNEIKLNETLGRSKILANQMNSHFIFNILSSIKELCYEDVRKAAECIDDFADYLKGNINGLSSDQLIPFETEMDHVIKYLILQKETLNRKVNVEYDLQIKDFKVPSLSVQPLVENAVRYGNRENGDIFIRSYIDGNDIVVSVRNSYIDIPLETGPDTDRIGFALKGIEEKLYLQCKGKLIVNRNENNVEAIIRIPKKEAML